MNLQIIKAVFSIGLYDHQNKIRRMEIFMATSIVSNVVLLITESFVRDCFIVTFFDKSDKQSKRFKTEEAI